MKPRVHYMPRIYLYIYVHVLSWSWIECNAWCTDTESEATLSRHGGRHVQTSLAFPFPPRVASRAYALRGGKWEREKAAERGERQGLRVTNWHYPLRTGRHRARCARGISREVSPSASSIPDAIVRVKVWTKRFCDRQFASEGNNYERFRGLSARTLGFTTYQIPEHSDFPSFVLPRLTTTFSRFI